MWGPSSTMTALMCACSRRRSLRRRFAAFRSQSFFVVPSSFRIGSGASGNTSFRSGWTTAAPRGLVVVRLRPVAVALHAAAPATDLVRGMLAGAIHRDQQMPVEDRPAFEHFAALQGCIGSARSSGAGRGGRLRQGARASACPRAPFPRQRASGGSTPGPDPRRRAPAGQTEARSN